MHDSDPEPRVKFHMSEIGLWSKVLTSNILFSIGKDRNRLLVFSGIVYHVARQAT